MRLSICIPTHHGRRDQLEAALESLADEARGDLPLDLELCVSDNASADGTEAMVAAFTDRHPDLDVVYGRNARDVGLANMLRVVERASGDWCWLFGSDDIVAEGAVRRLMEVIAAHPDATGIGFRKANFSHDLRSRLEGDAPEAEAPWPELRELDDAATIRAELVSSRLFMSTNAVRRDRWLAAAAAAGEAAVATGDWPQLVLLERMIAAHPRWVWLPATLVKARAGAPYVYEDFEGAPDLARVHIRLTSGLRRVWGAIAPDRALYRRMMAKAYGIVASSSVVANLKDRPGHTLRNDLGLLWSFAAAYWWLPAFRRHGLPLLLVPVPLWRRLRARQQAARGGPMPALDPAGLRAAVRAELPGPLRARDMVRVPCTVRNTSGMTYRSVDPHPVMVGYRWLDAHGTVVMHDGFREPLRRPLPPGGEAAVTLRVLTPWEPGAYTLELSPVQELVAWFADAEPGSALAFPVELGTG